MQTHESMVWGVHNTTWIDFEAKKSNSNKKSYAVWFSLDEYFKRIWYDPIQNIFLKNSINYKLHKHSKNNRVGEKYNIKFKFKFIITKPKWFETYE